ncbi:hypothetical protein EVC45_33180 [Paraburkholderia sp. UYCP14C]|uniref:hypothetical protein n=1 Tax=Paraburkholderia sp. UYCP14C TaxID=2511130 RepID=UPI001022369E|nr:hypothetical protein [Paraburkholderia sp. UYCP14C]RZF25510.1 hypothetical protein EVC45_33180 [Paraburkholderia sp. UYCP14C]
MKIDVSVKLGTAFVSSCLALGFAQASFAQTGANPSTQSGKSAAQPGTSLEQSRTPDTTSANNANGNVGEAGGATNGVAGSGNGRVTHKHTKGTKSMPPASGAGQ